MKFILSMLVLSAIFTSGLCAQDTVLTGGTPDEVGMDATILNAGVNMFVDVVERVGVAVTGLKERVTVEARFCGGALIQVNAKVAVAELPDE